MSVKELSIAVASADERGLEGQVSQHFGRCPSYTFVEIAEGSIHESRVEANPFADGHAPGQVPAFIAKLGAQVIITGGIGQRAIGFFEEQGVSVAAGYQGGVRDAVEAFLRGEIAESDPCPGGHGDCHEHE